MTTLRLKKTGRSKPSSPRNQRPSSKPQKINTFVERVGVSRAGFFNFVSIALLRSQPAASTAAMCFRVSAAHKPRRSSSVFL
jgi:hypothetical protein